jgi:hypothetical protein
MSVPAAVYLRVSSEHQQYSFENQSAAIEEYAVINDFQIIATYSDAAISGVTLRKRRGLQNLLSTRYLRSAIATDIFRAGMGDRGHCSVLHFALISLSEASSDNRLLPNAR